MRRKLVFWTAFNSYQSSRLLRDKPAGTIHPVRTAVWTNRRADLFLRYNLPSILAQTHQDFLYVILLDPELRFLTDPVLPSRPDPRVLYCYEDEPVLERLREYDEIVFTLIDNDDLYARTAGELLMACRSEWMYFKYGYAFDILSGRLYGYDTIGSGPFFAHRVSPQAITSFDREKRHPTHKAVITLGPTELDHGQFCVLLHERNTSSTPRMRYVKAPAPNPLAVARRFGLFGVRP